MAWNRKYTKRPAQVRFMVVARHYPDLEEGYTGPELSLDDQVEGVQREWPVLYATRADAEVQMAWLKVRPDPSFCSPKDELSVIQVMV